MSQTSFCGHLAVLSEVVTAIGVRWKFVVIIWWSSCYLVSSPLSVGVCNQNVICLSHTNCIPCHDQIVDCCVLSSIRYAVSWPVVKWAPFIVPCHCQTVTCCEVGTIHYPVLVGRRFVMRSTPSPRITRVLPLKLCLTACVNSYVISFCTLFEITCRSCFWSFFIYMHHY